MANQSSPRPHEAGKHSAEAAPQPAAPAPIQGQSAAAPRGMPPALAWDGGMNFLFTVHGRVNDDSRFSDSKAGVVMVVGTGLIASLYGAKLHLGVLTKPLSQWSVLEPLSALAYCLLGLGVFLAAWSMKPRLKAAHEKGFVFWRSIRGYSSPQEFWRAFREHETRDLIEHLAHHVYTLAGVCKAKYFWVGLSIWTTFFGALAAMAAVLLKDATMRAAGV